MSDDSRLGILLALGRFALNRVGLELAVDLSQFSIGLGFENAMVRAANYAE